MSKSNVAKRDLMHKGKIVLAGQEMPDGATNPEEDRTINPAENKPGASGSGVKLDEDEGVAADGSFTHTLDGKPTGLYPRTEAKAEKTKKAKTKS